MAKKDVTGCTILCLGMIAGPIWWVLFWSVLTEIQAAHWQWALFWVYVPTNVAGILVAGISKALLEDE